MRRLALLPHVFVSGARLLPPRPAYITARDLRVAIAANAALMTFAGTETPAAPSAGAEFALGAAPPPNATPANRRRGRAA
jgi:hypothetical protein